MARVRIETEAAYYAYYEAAWRLCDAIDEVTEPSDARSVAFDWFLARVYAEHQPEEIARYPITIELLPGMVALARDVLGEMVMPGSAGEVAVRGDGAVTVEE